MTAGPDPGRESLVPFRANAVDGGRDVSKYVLDRLFPVDVEEQPALGVEVEQWLRLDVEYLEPVRNGGLGVVGAAFPLGASQESAAQLVVADAEVDDRLEFDSLDLPGHRVRLFGLSECPGKAIEHVPAVRGCLDHGRGKHLEHELVRYEVAPLQVVGGDAPDPRATAHLGAQESPTRKMRDAVVTSQFLRLRALPGPRIRHQ